MQFKELDYQEKALRSLSDFLSAADDLRGVNDGIATAFKTTTANMGLQALYQTAAQANYNSGVFGAGIPWVCLRLPTGAGKTYLAARSIGIANEQWHKENNRTRCSAVWLVPSDMILTQTLGALKNSDHPYREALEKSFGTDLEVITLSELARIGVDDWTRKAIVIVTTTQALRIDAGKKDMRNVYSHSESFESHFAGENMLEVLVETHGLERVTQEEVDKAKLDKDNWQGLTDKDVGRVKYSAINVLKMHQPIVIVDEAHKNRSENGIDVITRLNASCVVEMTATPSMDMNVLFHVSAQALKAVDMIKLPVVLKEHKTNWEDCVYQAVQKRQELEAIANASHDPIRPIMLLQAESKSDGDIQRITPDVLKDHLVRVLKIPESQIAIATGTQKDLEGVPLLDLACPIRFVITVQALVEGWDCSFAYVLCSVQNMRSNTAIQQLLGRVLRMPYATKRQDPALNCAYAFVVSEHIGNVAADIVNRITDKKGGLGFNKMEAEDFFVPPPMQLFRNEDFPENSLFGAATPSQDVPILELPVSRAPDLSNVPVEEQKHISITTSGSETVVTLTAKVSDMLLEAIVKVAGDKNAKTAVSEKITYHNHVIQLMTIPSLRGDRFGTLPRLCARLQQGDLILLDPESMSHMVSWNIAKADTTLPAFELENNKVAVIDMEKGALRLTLTPSLQMDFEHLNSASESELIGFLEHRLQHDDITPVQMIEYLGRIVEGLQKRGFTLEVMVLYRYSLARVIDARIKALREKEISKGGEGILFDDLAGAVEASLEYGFTFEPNAYPVSNCYAGSQKFNNHYYPQIGDLKSQGQEFECAGDIDAHPKIDKWIRNLVNERFGFWLPTHKGGRAYPDFVCTLKNDTRKLVVEFKGGDRVTADDAKSKKRVGELWQRCSGNIYLMATDSKSDPFGRSVSKQIDDALVASNNSTVVIKS